MCNKNNLFLRLSGFWALAFFTIVFFSLSIHNTRANENRIALESMEWLEDEDHPIILELFTSQDCPGCSIADLILYNIGDKKNVIAMGCHVDYLEKLSQTASLAKEACTNRQWFYSASRWTGKAELKTPQFIANGDIKFAGLDHYNILNKIRTTFLFTTRPDWVSVSRNTPSTLTIQIPASKSTKRETESYGVWLIRYADSKIVKIPPNELSPETRIMRYKNVIQDFFHIARWYGEERTIEIDLNNLPRPYSQDEGGWFVVVQKRNGDPIVAAGKIKDE